MVHGTTAGRRFGVASALLIFGLALSACQIGGSAPPPEEVTPVGGGGAETTVAGTTATGGQTTAGTTATARTTTATTDEFGTTTGAAANISVSPNEVTLGNVVLTLGVQPAAPVSDAGQPAPTPADSNQRTTAAQAKGFAVLGGAGTKITNNFDPSQSAPADQPNQVIRHVALQIKDKASGQLIPQLGVTMDLLREGRGVLQDQPLAPMIPAGSDVSQLQYGNNVKFPGHGQYQVFVRIEPSPLLGGSSPGVAQFNVTVK